MRVTKQLVLTPYHGWREISDEKAAATCDSILLMARLEPTALLKPILELPWELTLLVDANWPGHRDSRGFAEPPINRRSDVAVEAWLYVSQPFFDAVSDSLASGRLPRSITLGFNGDASPDWYMDIDDQDIKVTEVQVRLQECTTEGPVDSQRPLSAGDVQRILASGAARFEAIRDRVMPALPWIGAAMVGLVVWMISKV